jgi:hypothetical protein
MRHLILLASLAMTPPAAAQPFDPAWEFVADTVMGGVSTGRVTREGAAARLTGEVSLENDGGFVQMAFDWPEGAAPGGGLAFEARGNGERYEVRLRTDALRRPWQSYRASFVPGPDWQAVTLPWSAFEAHRTDAPFDPAGLRRVGVIAVGREMSADVALRDLRILP